MSTTVQSLTLGVATVGGDFQVGGTDSVSIDGVTATVAFGTDSFVRTLAVSGLDARPTFGAVVLGQSIVVVGVDARPSFGTPTMQPGATSVFVSGLDARPTFGGVDYHAVGAFLVGGSQLGGSDVLGSGSYELTVAGFVAPVTFGTPFVGYTNVYASGLDARAVFGTPSLGKAIPVTGLVVSVRFGRVDAFPVPSSSFGSGLFGDGFAGGALGTEPLPVGAEPFVVGASAVGGEDALGGNGENTQRLEADRIWPPSPQFGAVAIGHVLRVAGVDARPSFGRPGFAVAIFGVSGLDARPTFGRPLLVGQVHVTGLDARATLGAAALLPVLRTSSIPVVVQWGVFGVQHVAGAGDDRAFLVVVRSRWTPRAVDRRWTAELRPLAHSAVAVRRRRETLAVRWRDRLSQDVE